MRLDAFTRMMTGQANPGSSAVMLATDPLRHRRVINLMRAQGVGVHLSRSVQVLSHYMDEDVQFLFVDHESLGGILRVLEPLFALRAAFPAVVVCLMTDDPRGADYGAERRALCDATLFTDAPMCELEYALSCAIKNNRKWQARQLEFAPMERR